MPSGTCAALANLAATQRTKLQDESGAGLSLLAHDHQNPAPGHGVVPSPLQPRPHVSDVPTGPGRGHGRSPSAFA